MFKLSVTFFIVVLQVYSKDTLNGVSFHSPNFIDKNLKSLEITVLESVFQCMGKKMSIETVPFGRHIDKYNSSDKFDFVTSAPASSKAKGYKTISHSNYYNGIVVDTTKFNNVKSLDDLEDLIVIGFQDASKILPGLKKKIPLMAKYKETVNQESQVRLLLNNRTDAIIIDSVIFYNYANKLKLSTNVDTKKKRYQFIDVFPTTKYHLYFRDIKNQKSFDSCLNNMYKAGKIEKIRNQYFINKLYRTI